MKKIIYLMCIFAVLFCSAGCKKQKAANVLNVGATPEPHAEMLNLIADDLAQEGITLKVIEFTDYVTPNEALESGQLDANFFQHLPYMDSFNKERGYHLVNAGGIHIEPIALYSKKITQLSELAEGATIAIPNDPTNEGRALLLLQSEGLITLDDQGGLEATVVNIIENPKSLKFREIEAASLPRVLDDVDAAVINGNYAIPAGFSANRDGLVLEGADSPYVNIICVKEGHENDKNITVLVKALQSDKVKNWIAEKYTNGEVVATF